MTGYEFAQPIVLGAQRALWIRTSDHAEEFVRACLQSQFTFARLNMLLRLERIASCEDVEEARLAFCAWASDERLLTPQESAA